MDSVIIEGKWNKSEHQFWKRLKKELFHSNVQIVCAESNSKIPMVLAKQQSVLNDKYEKSHEASNILICYDTTALDREVIAIEEALDEVLSQLAPSINVTILDYYCFEDCLLQFNQFMQWLFSKQRIEQDTKGFHKLIILVRRSRLSGIFRATCPASESHSFSSGEAA